MKKIIVLLALLVLSVSNANAGIRAMYVGVGDNAVEASFDSSYFLGSKVYAKVGALMLTLPNVSTNKKFMINSISAKYDIIDNSYFALAINLGVSGGDDTKKPTESKYTYGAVGGLNLNIKINKDIDAYIEVQGYTALEKPVVPTIGIKINF